MQPKWSRAAARDNAGRVAVVTGSIGGIGFAIDAPCWLG